MRVKTQDTSKMRLGVSSTFCTKFYKSTIVNHFGYCKNNKKMLCECNFVQDRGDQSVKGEISGPYRARRENRLSVELNARNVVGYISEGLLPTPSNVSRDVTVVRHLLSPYFSLDARINYRFGLPNQAATTDLTALREEMTRRSLLPLPETRSRLWSTEEESCLLFLLDNNVMEPSEISSIIGLRSTAAVAQKCRYGKFRESIDRAKKEKKRPSHPILPPDRPWLKLLDQNNPPDQTRQPSTSAQELTTRRNQARQKEHWSKADEDLLIELYRIDSSAASIHNTITHKTRKQISSKIGYLRAKGRL